MYPCGLCSELGENWVYEYPAYAEFDSRAPLLQTVFGSRRTSHDVEK